MSEQDLGDASIRIAISPEPTDEEAAAVAAVVAVLGTRPSERDEEPVQREDAWALAGRREGMRRPLWLMDEDTQW